MKKLCAGLLALLLAGCAGCGQNVAPPNAAQSEPAASAATSAQANPRNFNQAKNAFQMEQVAADIVAAVNSRDAEALRALMCRNLNSKVDDLSAKMEALFDGVDGQITAFSTELGSSYDGKRSGERIFQQNFKIKFKLHAKNYRLDILWEVFNSIAPAEEGLRRIFLGDDDALKVLVDLQATDGVEQWHE